MASLSYGSEHHTDGASYPARAVKSPGLCWPGLSLALWGIRAALKGMTGHRQRQWLKGRRPSSGSPPPPQQTALLLSAGLRWCQRTPDARENGGRFSGTTSYHYAANGNQLSSLSGTTTVSYTYDADGHLTSDGTRSWPACRSFSEGGSYDDRGRMASVTGGGVTTHQGSPHDLYKTAREGETRLITPSQ
jgi:YD repeat-containing protein